MRHYPDKELALRLSVCPTNLASVKRVMGTKELAFVFKCRRIDRRGDPSPCDGIWLSEEMYLMDDASKLDETGKVRGVVEMI